MGDSPYKVRTDRIGSVEVIVLADASHKAEAWVAPLSGFNCFHFEHEWNGQKIELLFPTDSEEELMLGGTGFGYPQLFPFPNRVKGGKYSVRGKDYQVDPNHHGINHIHGLVIDREFKNVESGVDDEQGAFVRGSILPDDYPDHFVRQFPFPFRFTLTYSLKDGALTVDTLVENTGDNVLPFGYGTHPYFPIPILPGGRRQDCEILIPANQSWVLDESIPTGERLSVEGRLDARSFRALGDETYDDVMTDIIKNEDGGSSCVIRDPHAGLQIRIWADAGYREWVVYAPEGRDLVAFEPYTCATDAVNLQARGLDAGWQELEPGASWSGRQRVSLEAC